MLQKDADTQILRAQGIESQGKVTSRQKYLVGMPLGYSTKGVSTQKGQELKTDLRRMLNEVCYTSCIDMNGNTITATDAVQSARDCVTQP